MVFSRAVSPLPAEVDTHTVDTQKVEATFKKGVLEISLPKTARAIGEKKKAAVKSS